MIDRCYVYEPNFIDARSRDDILAWLATLPEDDRKKFRSSGIKRDKEDKVLAAWKAEKKG